MDGLPEGWDGDLDDCCIETLLLVVEAAVAGGEASEFEMFGQLTDEQYSQFWACLTFKQRRQLGAMAGKFGWVMDGSGCRAVEVAA